MLHDNLCQSHSAIHYSKRLTQYYHHYHHHNNHNVVSFTTGPYPLRRVAQSV